MSAGDGVTSRSAGTGKVGRGFFGKRLLWVVPQPYTHSEDAQADAQAHIQPQWGPNRPSKQFQNLTPSGQKKVKGAVETSKFAPPTAVTEAEKVANEKEPPGQRRAPPVPPLIPRGNKVFSRSNFRQATLLPPAPPTKEPTKLNMRLANEASRATFVDEPPMMASEQPGGSLLKALDQNSKRKTFQDIMQFNHVNEFQKPAEEVTSGAPLGRNPLWRAALVSADLPPSSGHGRGWPKAPLPISPPRPMLKSPRLEVAEDSEKSQRHCADRVQKNLDLMGAQRCELRDLQVTMHNLMGVQRWELPAKQKSIFASCA